MDHAVEHHVMHVGCCNWETICHTGYHGQILDDPIVAAFGVVVDEYDAGFGKASNIEGQSLFQGRVAAASTPSISRVVV